MQNISKEGGGGEGRFVRQAKQPRKNMCEKREWAKARLNYSFSFCKRGGHFILKRENTDMGIFSHPNSPTPSLLLLLIHEARPTGGRDHFLKHGVRKSVSTFRNLAKQNKLEVGIVIVTGGTLWVWPRRSLMTHMSSFSHIYLRKILASQTINSRIDYNLKQYIL